MFEPLKLYRHKNNKTVAMQVIFKTPRPNDVELYVKWWGVGGCRNPMPMNIGQFVYIKPADFDNWIEMDIRKGRVDNPNYHAGEFKV